MAFLPIDGVMAIDVNWTMFAQLCQTTFYAGIIGADSIANVDVDGMTELVAAWWGTELCDTLPDAVVGRTAIGRSLHAAVTYEKTVDISAYAGASPSPALPGNAVIAIQRTANLTGRRSRGRIFLPLAENAVTGNTVDATHVTNTVTRLNGLEALIRAYGTDWYGAIVSRVPGGGLTPHGSWLAIDHWQAVDLNVDSQRRRLNGRGT